MLMMTIYGSKSLHTRWVSNALLLIDKRLTRIHIHKAGTIEIRLTRDDCQAFEVKRHPDKKKYFYYVEYEVILRGDNLRMTYEFLIPRTGKFERGSCGEEPIRKTCTLTLSSAFAFYTSPEDPA
jgi:hypothetical protein